MHELLTEKIVALAARTGVFNAVELDILKEVSHDHFTKPDKGYFMIMEGTADDLKGFVIYGQAPLTEYAWDMYWLAVDVSAQNQGVGRKLLKNAETEILKKSPHAVIRVETSSRKDYDGARHLYASSGYRETGVIKDFYKKNDDLVIYSRNF